MRFGAGHAWLVAAPVLFALLAAGCANQTADATGPKEPAVQTAADDIPTVADKAIEAGRDPVTEEAASPAVRADNAAAPTDGQESAPVDAPPASESDSTDESASPGQETTSEKVPATTDDDKPTKTFSSSRAPARPGEAEKISFDDLIIGLQADVVYRPWMMKDRPKELDGKKVRIIGFMHGGIENPDKVPEFVLLRNLECKFGPGGQADHLAMVYMKRGEATTYPGKESIKVEGTLKIEPLVGVDGNTWSLYRIEDAVVVR